jgi:hypothetical protein
VVRPFVPAICNCILDMGVFLGFPHRISRTPLVQRRGAALARLIAKARAGLHLNNYLAEPGEREAEEDWGEVKHCEQLVQMRGTGFVC